MVPRYFIKNWTQSIQSSLVTSVKPCLIWNPLTQTACGVAYLLGRDLVTHDNSRISRWAETQKETCEAGTVPAPEPLIGSNGFRKICRSTMVVAAKGVCQNNRQQYVKQREAHQSQNMHRIAFTLTDWILSTYRLILTVNRLTPIQLRFFEFCNKKAVCFLWRSNETFRYLDHEFCARKVNSASLSTSYNVLIQREREHTTWKNLESRAFLVCNTQDTSQRLWQADMHAQCTVLETFCLLSSHEKIILNKLHNCTSVFIFTELLSTRDATKFWNLIL